MGSPIMVSTKQRKILDVPIRLVFTDQGVNHFLKNKQRLSRFRLSDAHEEYGVQLVDFAPHTVQKMMRLDYVSKIELTVDDIVAHRSGLIDFTKLVMYGMLYRQFDTEVFEALVESDMVRKWNRHNAKNPIDFKTNVNTSYLQRVLSRNTEGVSGMKRDILVPVFHSIATSATLIDEEKRLHRLIAERFLDALAPLSQFLLVAHKDTPSYKAMAGEIRERVQRYLKKTSVPEYLALMILELLTSLKHGGGFLRRNDEAAQPARSGGTERAGHAEPISLLWKLRTHSRSPGDRGRLQIVISNRQTRFEDVKDIINDRSNLAVTKKSLNDFYQEDPDAADTNSLGLYYLSFVHEACRSVGIHFESFVHAVGEEDQTMINLVLLF